MSIVNSPFCGGAESTFNLADLLCDIKHGSLQGLVFLDPGVEFTAGDVATLDAFTAAIAAATRAPRGSRAYPLFGITNIDDTTQEPQRVSEGNNTTSQITLVDAIPSYSFQHRKGLLYQKQLAAAASSNLSVLMIDNKNAVYGVQTAGGGLRGFTTSEIYVGLPRFGTASAASNYPFSITFAYAHEFLSSAGFIQCDDRILQLTGMESVTVTVTGVAGNVVSVKLTTIANKNLYETYSTELAQASAWVIKDASGASVTVTAAGNGTTKAFDLTLSGTPWTSASVNDVFSLNLAAPTVLAASPINVDGFEGIATTFLKP